MPIRMIPHACWVLMVMMIAATEHGDRNYREEIQKWRTDYEAGLKQDNGWLTLAGLFWLKEGDNSFGCGLRDDIVLPEGSAPQIAGKITFHNGNARLLVKNGSSVLLNGEPIRTEMPLKPDTKGRPDRITLGRLSMVVIERGGRYGIRVWDNGSPVRRSFTGTRWFQVNEAYRVTAQFISYPQPKMIPILNVLGQTEPAPSPGYATFAMEGRECRLEPVLEENRLFFIFKDLTAGRQTYAAGRFLYSDLPRNGKVILDFNLAHNPPCAFTAYATCPLPPKQNYLPVAIAAGELNPEHAAPAPAK